MDREEDQDGGSFRKDHVKIPSESSKKCLNRDGT